MAMTIIEMLEGETPRSRKFGGINATLKPVFRFVQKHMEEIEEARSRKYSWTQIEVVCRELWESGKDADKITWWKKSPLIETCYHALKKGLTSTSSKAKPKGRLSQKYRIEVTPEE